MAKNEKTGSESSSPKGTTVASALKIPGMAATSQTTISSIEPAKPGAPAPSVAPSPVSPPAETAASIEAVRELKKQEEEAAKRLKEIQDKVSSLTRETDEVVREAARIEADHQKRIDQIKADLEASEKKLREEEENAKKEAERIEEDKKKKKASSTWQDSMKVNGKKILAGIVGALIIFLLIALIAWFGPQAWRNLKARWAQGVPAFAVTPATNDVLVTGTSNIINQPTTSIVSVNGKTIKATGSLPAIPINVENNRNSMIPIKVIQVQGTYNDTGNDPSMEWPNIATPTGRIEIEIEEMKTGEQKDLPPITINSEEDMEIVLPSKSFKVERFVRAPANQYMTAFEGKKIGNWSDTHNGRVLRFRNMSDDKMYVGLRVTKLREEFEF